MGQSDDTTSANKTIFWIVAPNDKTITKYRTTQYDETFSALLAICADNSSVTGEFPSQRPVTRSFDVFFDLRLNKQLSKQWRGWWFETPWRPWWRHCHDLGMLMVYSVVRFITQYTTANSFGTLYYVLCCYYHYSHILMHHRLSCIAKVGSDPVAIVYAFQASYNDTTTHNQGVGLWAAVSLM